MSGQGMIGFTVAVTQFFAAWQAAKPSSSSPASASATLEGTALQVQDEAIITATSRFFFVSLIFSIFAALASLTLTRWIPLYRDIKDRGTLARIPARNRDDHHEHMDGDLDEDDDAQESHPAVDQQAPSSIHELFRVNRKILGLGLAVFNIFLVTIGLFPGITSSVAAVNLEWPIGSVSTSRRSVSFYWALSVPSAYISFFPFPPPLSLRGFHAKPLSASPMGSFRLCTLQCCRLARQSPSRLQALRHLR